MRLWNDRNAADLISKEEVEPWEYFAGEILKMAAEKTAIWKS